jgi:hypothetical protein
MRSGQFSIRPYVAALLGSFVTGLGHLYLGRWRRAFGWVLLLTGTVTVFVGPVGVQRFITGGTVPPLDIVPVLLVSGLSVFDVYSIARTEYVPGRGHGKTTTPDCPACGKELDPEIHFCPWCATEFETLRVVPAGEVEQWDG